MFNLIASLLREHGVELFDTIRISDCRIAKPYLLSSCHISDGTAIVMAVPYLARGVDNCNVSKYAIAKDYHIFYKELFESIIGKLKEAYPENNFAGFADHSPIDEIDTAAKCGLGMIGRHGLLITKDHSSFVFIGTLFTDAILPTTIKNKTICENCGACINACPVGLDKSICLSSRTQKKGELDEDTIGLMKTFGTVWGCDICQNVCPHTKSALNSGTIYSNMAFFNSDIIPYVTYDTINNMSEEEFKNRAYSWRGRDIMIRNLKAIDEK